MSYGGGTSDQGESANWSGAGPASPADAYNQLAASMAAGSYTPNGASAINPAAGISGVDPASSTNINAAYSSIATPQTDVPNIQVPKDLEVANTLGGTLGVVDAFYETAPADMEAIGVGTAGKTLGLAGFAIQTGISIYDGYSTIDAYGQGRIDTSQLMSSVGKNALDVTVGTVAVLTGQVGACIGACYFVADQTSFVQSVQIIVETAQSAIQGQIESYYNYSNPMNH